MIEAAGQQILNINGMHGLIDAVLGIAVAALAVSIAVRSHGGKFAKVIEMVVVVLIAAFVAGLSNGGNFSTLGTQLFSLIHG